MASAMLTTAARIHDTDNESVGGEIIPNEEETDIDSAQNSEYTHSPIIKTKDTTYSMPATEHEENQFEDDNDDEDNKNYGHDGVYSESEADENAYSIDMDNDIEESDNEEEAEEDVQDESDDEYTPNPLQTVHPSVQTDIGDVSDSDADGDGDVSEYDEAEADTNNRTSAITPAQKKVTNTKDARNPGLQQIKSLTLAREKKTIKSTGEIKQPGLDGLMQTVDEFCDNTHNRAENLQQIEVTTDKRVDLVVSQLVKQAPEGEEENAKADGEYLKKNWYVFPVKHKPKYDITTNKWTLPNMITQAFTFQICGTYNVCFGANNRDFC
jgi:hypothetical protein